MQCPMLVYVCDTSQHYSLFFLCHGATKPGFEMADAWKRRSLLRDDTGNTNNNLNKLKNKIYIDLRSFIIVL